jgi:hypothetical protein
MRQPARCRLAWDGKCRTGPHDLVAAEQVETRVAVHVGKRRNPQQLSEARPPALTGPGHGTLMSAQIAAWSDAWWSSSLIVSKNGQRSLALKTPFRKMPPSVTLLISAGESSR